VEGEERAVGSGGANSMIQFWLDTGDDGIKHCRKMKRRHRVRLGFIEKKCDTIRRCDDLDRRRCSTYEGKGMRQCQLG
jgi:hypothetical protein